MSSFCIPGAEFRHMISRDDSSLFLAWGELTVFFSEGMAKLSNLLQLSGFITCFCLCCNLPIKFHQEGNYKNVFC